MRRIAWWRKEQLLWTGKRQFFSLSSSKRKTEESALTIDPPITLLSFPTKVYARILEANDAFGQNNWPSCSHFDKTVIHSIIGNHDERPQRLSDHWQPFALSTMIVKKALILVGLREGCVFSLFMPREASHQTIRVVSALRPTMQSSAPLKTKRTVYWEYPSGELERRTYCAIPRSVITKNGGGKWRCWTSYSHLCSPTMD